MILDLLRRALDVREANAARTRAEEAYRHVLGLLAETGTGRRRERSQDDDVDLRAASTVIADLDERLMNALKAHREVADRCAGLEKQLDALTRTNANARRATDLHQEVAKLPPPVNRDREALSRLAAENASLREQLQDARQRAVELEKQLEGNPS